MNKIVRSVCDTARDRQELNKGGIPVKNASYWKRQCDQLRIENVKMRILLREYARAESDHDNAYDIDRVHTEDILYKVRRRVFAFLRGEVDDE